MATGAPTPRPERRLAAVLATDVVGFARLVAEDEDGTLARLRSLRKEFGEPLIAAHGGRTVKLAGDGAIVEFPSAVEAVRCAMAFQRGVAERERGVPPARRILFRMGINLGDITVEDDDVYGNGVNVAARLEQIAAPGGIMVARNVWNQVKARLDIPFQALGERRLKNIPEPVGVYAVRFEGAPAVRWRPMLARLRPRGLAVAALLLALAAAIAVWALRAGPEAVPARGAMPDRPSLAVLAFDNFSGDPEQGYLADGMAEDLITELARNRDLAVMARNTSFSFKGQGRTAQDIARELGVRYVLEGSIRRGGERIVVNAQLVDGHDGRHVWAERYDLAAGDVHRVQGELVGRIAGILFSEVRETEKAASLRRPPDNLDVYELTLRGLALKHRQSKENFVEGRRSLERAIALDPDYAPAHAYLGYINAIDAGAVVSGELGRADLPAAIRAIRRAVELDPDLPTSYQALSFALAMAGSSPESLEAAQRSVELGPGDAENLILLCRAQGKAGRYDEAIATGDLAMRLNPIPAPYYYAMRAISLYAKGRMEEVVQATTICLNKAPGYAPCRLYLALALGAKGELAAAREHVAEVLRQRPSFTLANAAAVLGYPSDPTLTARVLDAMRQAGMPGVVPTD